MTEVEDHFVDGHTSAQEARNDAVVDTPVVVAVDMSESSRVALLWACEYAARAGLPVTALHVVHDPAEAPGRYRRDGHAPLRPASEVAGEMLAEFLAKMQTDHPELELLAQIDRKLAEGLPAHTIVNQARRLRASLIVLGSRNQSSLQRFMNGSTAQKVMQLSSAAVTIVKAPGL